MIELSIYVIAFIALSGMLATIEASILSVSQAEVDEVAAEGKFGASDLKRVLGQLTRAVVVIVIFTNIVNILGPILIGRKTQMMFGGSSILVVTIVLVLGTIVFSEIVPKSLGHRYAPLIGRFTAPSIRFSILALFPLVLALEWFAALFKSGERVIGTETQIRSLARRGQKAGLIETDENKMIHRVFVLNDKTAASIMTPIDKVVALRESMTIEEGSSIAREHEFSRYPLFGQSQDVVCGIVLSRSVQGLHLQGANDQLLTSVALSCPIVEAHLRADELLTVFRKERVHMAIVQDDGHTVGLVTLEDVLEQLVGAIDDEKDVNAN